MPIVHSFDQLPRLLADSQDIYLSGCSAEILQFPPNPEGSDSQLERTVTGIFIPGVNRTNYCALGYRTRTFFMTPSFRKELHTGRVAYLPWHYPEIVRWMNGASAIDTALVMVSPPDGNGFCSLGVQTDFLPILRPHISRLIGVVNSEMPRTFGESGIHLDDFDAIVQYETPLIASDTGTTDAVSEAIALRVADIVGNDATVQFGIGKIPKAVMMALRGNRRLRIHSGLIDDSALTLAASGALDRDVPITTGVAIGTQALYTSIHAEPDRYKFRPVSYTHNHSILAGIAKFRAINSALQIDLLGQVDAETAAGRFVSGPGGLSSFARGAIAAPGGRSIVALPSIAPDGNSRIVSGLSPNAVVTLGKSDMDWVVTEHGAACIRDLGLVERGFALIELADPRVRDELSNEWRIYLDSL